MDKQQNYNIEKLVKFRQNMHQNPEIGFKEFYTQKCIKEYLLSIGVQEQQITVCATTGLCIDIYGKSKPEGNNFLMALRADIDALQMTEQNPDLPYKSQNKNADHACGHDGHTTTLLGVISLLMDNIDKIPSNKGLRTLFQPSEEGPESRAVEMIKQGCLQGVNEIYAYHNWPKHPVGYLLVKSGVILASAVPISIELYGKGGHASDPKSAIDPVQMSVDFYQKFNYLNEVTFKERNYVCTLPVCQVGERFNVISNKAVIQGSLRGLEDNIVQDFKKSLIQILEEVKQLYPGSSYKLDYKVLYEQTTNHPKQTQYVQEIGTKYFGQDKVGEFGILPLKGAEDFSFYMKEIPGCYFFLGGGKTMGEDPIIHDCHYNYNDDLIQPSTQFIWELVQQRFQQNN